MSRLPARYGMGRIRPLIKPALAGHLQQGGGEELSAIYSTLVADTFTPASVGGTVAISGTVKNTSNVAVAGKQPVLSTNIERVSNSLSTTAASPTTIANNGTSASVCTVTVLDRDGNPMGGVPAAFCVLAVSGTGNTVTQPTGFTNYLGRISGSFVSTGAATKTVSWTVAGRAVTATSNVVVSGSALPSGWSVVSEQPWDASPNAGWSINVASYANPSPPPDNLGTVTLVTDGTHGTAVEFAYFTGLPNGQGPGGVTNSIITGATGYYMATEMLLSADFVTQDPGIKMSHMYVTGASWNLYWLLMCSTGDWSGFNANPNQYIMGTTGWGGATDGLNDYASGVPFNNISQAAATRVFGTPQRVEWQVHRGTAGNFDGIVRQWVDGVLTAEWTAVRFPSGGTLERVNFSGTYGGGAFDVPSGFNFRILNSIIGTPP